MSQQSPMIATLGDHLKPRVSKGIPSENPAFDYLGLEHVESHKGRILGFGASEEYKSSSPLVEPGDVLYGRLRPYLNKVVLAPKKMYVSGEFIVFPPSETLQSRFLQYLLMSPDFLAFTALLDTGDRPRVSWDKIAKFEFLLPPLDEQRRIVETLDNHLSRLDKALAQTKQAQSKTESFIKSYLLSIIGGQSPLVESGGGWQKRSLGSLGKWRGGGTPSKSNPEFWVGGSVPWLTAKDMKVFRMNDTQDHITELGVAGSSASLLPKNAVVVVTRSGILAWKLPVAITEVPVTINQDLKALVCTPDVNPEWVAYSILGFEHRILEECRKAGTTVANLNFDDFLKFEIFIPSLEEQENLVSLIKGQLDYLDSIQVKVDDIARSIETIRRSLLKSAFSGELLKVG